jgi:hypothetical protein
MYSQLNEQSKIWLQENPNAQIRVVSVGFSRGAEQAAGFTRLVEERGIQDPLGVKKQDGELVYTRPALVAPGQVVQAVGLFDPVGTGVPRDHDRRLPPSVISGFQITAEDERRDQFKSTHIIDPGFHEQNRFLNVTVGGAHSNIGGSYVLNGLGVRSGNLMIDYVNSLSDKPFLQKSAVPTDPSMNVVHRSEEHLFIYGTKDFERNNGRVRIEEVAPKSVARTGADVTNKQPHNEITAQQFPYRNVPIAPEVKMTAPNNSTEQQRSGVDLNQLNDADRRLYQSLEAAKKLHSDLGLPFDVNGQNMAASVMLQAKRDGLTSVERIVLNEATDKLRAGQNIIAQADRNHPAPERSQLSTQLAINTPVADSFRQLDQFNTELQRKQQVNQPQPSPPAPENTMQPPGSEPKQHTLNR